MGIRRESRVGTTDLKLGIEGCLEPIRVVIQLISVHFLGMTRKEHCEIREAWIEFELHDGERRMSECEMAGLGGGCCPWLVLERRVSTTVQERPTDQNLCGVNVKYLYYRYNVQSTQDV